ncbi:MaoC family dehydratase [Lutibaculum baratangense]|uniref:Mesaconyl-CoA hydratase n=1 Tax=Lutibaculum baratangense AMV1 TaxID=631454 RepID=V4RTR7_9HYPH|nr:MaoC family dehydratase [Lutibaculum baratangense]ESR26475.1 Mesaconyl-CoA hydratase [Lutibaculum baratangense AMV1]
MTGEAKSSVGRFFEDFAVGEVIHHATPRTITHGDVSLYTALTGSRFALPSGDTFARAVGYPRSPVDDLLVFHVVFGRTVADISRNAILNLGYAGCRFLKAVYPGDTLTAISEIIGLKESTNGRSGVVYVRSQGVDQEGERVLDYVRWVLIRKSEEGSPAPDPLVPDVPSAIAPDALGDAVPEIDAGEWDWRLSGSPSRHGDYVVGERIDHVDGMTIEEAEHQMAARLYQNSAKLHFNQITEVNGRYGRRVVYGGHVISVARALSFNGLQNAFQIAAINRGRHVMPVFAGDTIHAWSEVLDTASLPGREDVGALRLRLVATKDRPCYDFPYAEPDGSYDPSVVLDLDYWAVLPR